MLAQNKCAIGKQEIGFLSQKRGDGTTTSKIPQIIMQTWKNRDVPSHWQPSPISIKKYMPGWKYVLMTDTDNRNFVQQHFPDFLPYFDGFKHPIQRADAIRYMWLYINGGIYMDLDIELLRPLDSMFTHDVPAYFVKSGNTRSIFTNAFMAARPGCKIFLECLEEMKKPLSFWSIGKHLEVMNSTGPLMLNRVLSDTTTPYISLPRPLLVPCDVCNLQCDVSEAYARALPGSSWAGWDSTLYNFFLCNWKDIIFVFIVLIVLVVILYVFWPE